MNYIPQDATDSEIEAPMMSFIVLLDRPSSEDLQEYNRADKYQILKNNSSERRRDLILFVEEHELQNEVEYVGEPTVFNTLLIECTKRAAGLIANAPGVVDITQTDDFQVDLSSIGE